MKVRSGARGVAWNECCDIVVTTRQGDALEKVSLIQDIEITQGGNRDICFGQMGGMRKSVGRM